MGNKESGSVTYKNAFTGSDLVDWLINNKEMNSREEAVKECRRLLENDIIRHGKVPSNRNCNGSLVSPFC